MRAIGLAIACIVLFACWQIDRASFKRLTLEIQQTTTPQLGSADFPCDGLLAAPIRIWNSKGRQKPKNKRFCGACLHYFNCLDAEDYFSMLETRNLDSTPMQVENHPQSKQFYMFLESIYSGSNPTEISATKIRGRENPGTGKHLDKTNKGDIENK